MKRILSLLILLAFVLVDAAPCQAAFTRCGMKMPLQNKRCGECLADAAAGPVLTAASCCRVEAGADRSTTPAVLSGNAAGSGAPGKVAPAPAPTPSAAAAGAVRAAVPGHTTGLGPPLLAARSTILRL
jgi:hypothetical protein